MADNSSSRRKGGLWTHWLPLAVTVTVATAGVAAWAWSQRSEKEERKDQDDMVAGLDYEHGDYGDNPAYGSSSREMPKSRGPRQDPSHDVGGQTQGTMDGAPQPGTGDNTWGSRVTGALRRTPSPQQFFENAGKSVTAGMAAAGAAAGRALASIREDDKGAYADHETWGEEAETRGGKPEISRSRQRRTVAIVVSADTPFDDDEDGFVEHASVLSHIPRHIDFSQVKVFILIYAPGLKEPTLDPTSNLPPPSLSSSFSNIDHQQAQAPGADDPSKSPQSNASVSPAFNAMHSQALGLVEKESMVLPFTTSNGYVHMLRHIQPEVVYLQESLAGEDGSAVTSLQTWLRHEIILVVGAESGHGGLADSESEAERPAEEEKWWQRPDRVGRGRGVVVVDGMRVNDDWMRRVQGRE